MRAQGESKPVASSSVEVNALPSRRSPPVTWRRAAVALTATMTLMSSASLTVASAQNANLDQFNYDKTDGYDYGPQDWRRVRCPNTELCEGWPDPFHMSIGWDLNQNHCRWCPKDGRQNCGAHHQSPIDLRRNRAIEGHPEANECIDIHWMAYSDSTCNWNLLVEKNAFSIERHALKLVQPLRSLGGGKYELDCPNNRWGQIDFSRGFSQWWHLSHLDIHVPSEHTQEGKRYDGELHLYHWYSVSGEEAGIDNEMASVTVFLEAYDDVGDNQSINRLICQWREVEERTRRECDLPSVLEDYPGCFYYRRGHDAGSDVLINQTGPVTQTQSTGTGRRHLRQQTTEKPLSAHDIILENHKYGYNNDSYVPKTIVMNKEDYEPIDPDFDWEAFIAAQTGARVDAEEEELGEAGQGGARGRRRLNNYRHVDWFNYFPMIDVRTEYYYRYSGTQTVPPCYGEWFAGSNRKQTNHWRIMKDPMRISQRQIEELNRLIRERIAPKGDALASCEKDTAAKIMDKDDPNSRVWTARPLQSNQVPHFKVFCECQDWRSKFTEDVKWCRKEQRERYYQHPYNFKTDGF